MNQTRQNIKMNEEAINILKGLSYSQLQLEDQRIKIINSGYFNDREAYFQMDRKSIQKVYPVDLIQFLSIHRLAASERECQYLIWATGSHHPYLTPQQFAIYITNGRPQILDKMQSSVLSRNMQNADEMIKNYSERSLGKIFQKEIEYYRTIQLLRQQFVKIYGFQFNVVIECIDRQRKGNINFHTMLNFIHRNTQGVEFSVEQFEALCRKLGSKSRSSLSYKELMKAFSPFEPLNFPTYRKQSNIQKAMEYINQQVKILDIDTYALTDDEDRIKKTSTGFQRVVDQFRNPVTKGTHINTKYFYDKNYYNELKQYKTNFFDPNKDIKKKLQTQMIGPQYHDHFFSDYYLYLQERNKTEHYYNKFGKRYTYENNINKTLQGRK